MDEVVEAFHDKRALQAKAGAAVGGGGDVIKVTGPVKKQFFTPEESKSIQMSLSKFAKPEPLKIALTDYDKTKVTND